MKQYSDLVKDILKNGEQKPDRTNTGTLSVFGREMRFDLTKGFPLLSLKKTYFEFVVAELLWMLKGDTNTKFLKDNKVTFWDEWANESGDLGRIYGAQWREFRGICNGAMVKVDQIANLVESLKKDPHSRRHLVSAWNPAELPEMALPPCHYGFQCYVSNSGKLSMKMLQRKHCAFA